MSNRLFLVLFSLCFFVSSLSLSAQVYLDADADLEARVEDALSRMTLREKVDMLHAQSKFSSPGVARLGIAGIWCTDGPHGIRPEVMWDEWNQAGWTNDSCTAFPALTCLAATWNTDLAHAYGVALGEEAVYRNKSVVLGPGVNIYRTPLNGRNFEYMGEDPYLSATMVVPYIKGLQSNGVAACVKHYALNNQEVNRHGYDVEVSDRALYEIYLPAFKAAVMEGKAWSIMGAYNLYKGQHACHNQYLLRDILRGEWGFDGAVISDWGGAHNTDEAVMNGLDLEYGTWTNGTTTNNREYDNYFLADPLLKGIAEGRYTEQQVDEKVRNVLRLIFRTSMNKNRGFGSMVSESHVRTAREVAAEGVVLLKNDGALLPLSSKDQHILVVGENAIKMMTVGGGSSQLKVKYEVSPLQGIENKAQEKGGFEVMYERGYTSGEKIIQDNLDFGEKLDDPRTAAQMVSDAVKAAKQADIVIFVGGLNKKPHQDCEDSDRESYNLPYGQDELIKALAEANKRLVVVNVSGNAVAMPWVDKVPAIVQTWYSGTEGGNGLADVLFGDVNACGKLPFSFMKTLKDYPAHQYGEEAYPGVGSRLVYKEDIFVGYRYADKVNNKTTLFPFGHGLSYTTFDYGTAQITNPYRTEQKPVRNTARRMRKKGTPQMKRNESLFITIPITNTGYRDGKEVVQLYIADKKSSLPRPVKELKAFQKVMIKAGETKNVTFAITDDMLRFFDPDKHEWVSEIGDFEAIIGSSATDQRKVVKFQLQD